MSLSRVDGAVLGAFFLLPENSKDFKPVQQDLLNSSFSTCPFSGFYVEKFVKFLIVPKAVAWFYLCFVADFVAEGELW